MSSEAIVAISAAVVAFVQLAKWAGLKDHWGPIIVILFSGVGVMVWLISQPTWPPVRTDTWSIASGWIAVALSAAGVFGFTRAGAMAVTRATAPPDDGAGSSATTDSPTLDYERLAVAMDTARRKRNQEQLREQEDALISKPPAWLPEERR